MSKEKATSITVEEAVTLMINMDAVDANCSLYELLEAICDDAENALANAIKENCTDSVKNLLRSRVASSQSRYELALSLHKNLNLEIENPSDSLIKLANDSNDEEPRMTFDSVKYWAIDRHCLKMPTQETKATPVKKPSWRDVRIKIYDDYEIDCYVNGRKIETSYKDIGFMGVRKCDPNKDGLILMGILAGQKYPPVSCTKVSERVAMNRIRSALQKLTGIPGNPFTYHPNEGYRPVFKHKIEHYSKSAT